MLNDGLLPPEFATAAGPALGEERTLWFTHGDARDAFWRAWPIWLFAVPWTAFAVFWEAMVAGSFFFGGEGMAPAGWPGVMQGVMTLFGIPFVLIGFGMLAAPFWVARKTGRTIHVLTPTRLVRVTRGSTSEVQSMPLSRIVGITRRERRDGSGSLILSFGHHRDDDGDLVEKTEEIHAIAQVAVAERQLRAAIVAAGGTA